MSYSKQQLAWRAGGKGMRRGLFVKWHKDHADQHPGLMSIQQRYAWYNEWFYENRKEV